jgi:predicted membrane-bound dolichyl-phosphate-mannose-protein mannosyltransferase
MMVIMALTRDINSNIIITCDVVKITANKKKMLKFFDVYKKYFIKEQNNLINMDYIYTNSLVDNYLDDSYYYDTVSNNTIYENDSDNGYMDVLPYDNNNDDQPLIN